MVIFYLESDLIHRFLYNPMYKEMTKNILEDNNYIPIPSSLSSLYNCFIFSCRGWKQSTTSGNTVPPVDNSS